MVKKMIQWGLYAAFLGVLLGGATYRTSLKFSDTGQGGNRGKTSNNEPVSENVILPVIDQENRHNQERIVVDGQIARAGNQGLSIHLSDGQLLEIPPRPWRYAQSFGFTAQVGDKLWLEGFYENGNFEVARMINLHTGQEIVLRDNDGHPLWSGSK
jgi:hypothetical protein